MCGDDSRAVAGVKQCGAREALDLDKYKGLWHTIVSPMVTPDHPDPASGSTGRGSSHREEAMEDKKRTLPKKPPVRPENPTPEQEEEYLRLKREWELADGDGMYLRAHGEPALPDDGDDGDG